MEKTFKSLWKLFYLPWIYTLNIQYFIDINNSKY